MKIHKVNLPKTELASLPENELNFFLQACRMLNEINILHKITSFSNKDVITDAERRAQNSQSLFFLTILSGKLWEGWELIEKSYFGSKLSKTYHNLLPNEAKDSLNNLKIYFDNPENLVKKIRDKIAFHFDSAELMKQFSKSNDDEIFEIYLSGDQGNCCYFLPYALLLNAILEWTGIPDSLKATKTFFSDLLTTATLFNDFLNHYLVTVAKKNVGWNLEEMEIQNPPSINEIFLPFFVRQASKKE